MNADEKCVLYNFFKTACEYIDGYKANESVPFFLSDELTSSLPESPNETTETEIPVEANPKIFSVSPELYKAVLSCRKCGLCETRHNTVAGEGPEELSHLQNSVKVIVVGEGPGADEDLQGRPFVGKAGQLLDKMLEAINLSRKTNCYIANIVKCRPPSNRDPHPDEISACMPFLKTQIEMLNPKAILIVGRIAAQVMLNTQEGIGKVRGRFFTYNGIPAMATYHPSALLRNEMLKRPAWEDLKVFRAKLAELG